MANLRDIKDRIKSIESTKKITRAMKMVAAAKVKKSETAVKAARPYTRELVHMFQKLLNSVTEFSADTLKIKHAIDDYPALLQKREVKNVGLLVLTSNKGLAGAYNANVVRETLKRIKEYKDSGIGVYLFIAGQKGISALKKKCAQLNCPIVHEYYSAIENPSPMEAREIAEDMAEYFVSHKIDKVEIITTKFKNMMYYFVEDWPVLPVFGVVDVYDRITDDILDPLMEFYPDKHHILQKIVPMYMTNIFYQALLEAQASELASRMTAMSAASTNAEKMIKELSIEYNKTRQFAITQEIIEVVSGANSQKG
ncbi:MAG: ATP synthase F1 subunit gamma [Cyanobacteria bacterium SIG26]|nr:ATP synthase F1 subunit gamma [Cyanobacteria bacterium SIG26]